VENAEQVVVGSVVLVGLGVLSHFLHNPEDWRVVKAMWHAHNKPYSRWKHFTKILSRWWLMLNAAWALLSSADTLVSHYGSTDLRKAWDASWIAPKWGWTTWALGLLFITLVLTFEVTFQAVLAAHVSIAGLEQRIIELTSRSLKIIGVPEPQINQYPTATGKQYRVDVFNSAQAKSVSDVEVKLVNITPNVPNLRLPLNLPLMHDRSQPPQTSFQLNPQDHKYFDLVLNRSDLVGIFVSHTVSGVQNHIPSGDYVITVQATGNDVPIELREFRVSDTAAGGELHCEMLPDSMQPSLYSRLSE
jgi:hypothetical protein